jgi:hypothetical protein
VAAYLHNPVVWPLDMWLPEVIEVPDWLERLELARALNCKPWELDDVPLVWTQWVAGEMHIRNKIAQLRES